MAMTISKTLLLLDNWAQDAAGAVLEAQDAWGTVAAHARSTRYAAMAASIREALAAGSVPVVVVPKRRKARAKMDAPEFWAVHGSAVQAIIATYGLNWKVRAPFGETELVQVPSGWCSWKSPAGVRVTWPRDGRFPAAKYWPDGALPAELEIRPDYPRAIVAPRGKARDAAWYRGCLTVEPEPDITLADDLEWSEAAD